MVRKVRNMREGTCGQKSAQYKRGNVWSEKCAILERERVVRKVRNMREGTCGQKSAQYERGNVWSEKCAI